MCKLSGSIPELNFPNIIVLSLWNNNLTGEVPDFQFENLTYLYVDDNSITKVPDFSSESIIMLQTFGNKLTIGELEKNFGKYHEYNFAPQDTTLALALSDGNKLEIITDGRFNKYTWYLNGELLEGEEGKSIEIEEFGNYHCVVESKILKGIQYTTEDMEITTNVEELSHTFAEILNNKNELQISSTEASPFYVDIYTVNGLKKYVKGSVYMEIRIDLSDFSSGAYFVRVKSKDKLFSEKIIVNE